MKRAKAKFASAARRFKGTPRHKSSRQPTTSLDRSVVKVFNSFEEADQDDLEYWASRTPYERLRELERLRQLNYGYAEGKPQPRLQRIVTVAKLRKG
jgi:hypothetical protein